MELQATGEWFHCKVRRFWSQYLLGSIRVLCFITTLTHLFGLFKNSSNFNLSGVLLVWNCYPTGESLLSLVHMTDFKMATGKVSGVFRWIPCIIWLDDLNSIQKSSSRVLSMQSGSKGAFYRRFAIKAYFCLTGFWSDLKCFTQIDPFFFFCQVSFCLPLHLLSFSRWRPKKSDALFIEEFKFTLWYL